MLQNTKGFKESIKKDKWLLPLINLLIVVFGGFYIFTTFVGYDYAISLYGFCVSVLIALFFTPLAKNTTSWYTNAPVEFHFYLFVILTSILMIFTATFAKRVRTIR